MTPSRGHAALVAWPIPTVAFGSLGAFFIDHTSSIAAFAEWVRSLPIQSLAPVGVLFVGGALLLAFGRKLLKPVLVIASIFAGVILSVRVGQSLNTTVSPFIWSIGGAFVGIVFVVALYRLTLALSVAAIGAVAAMLIATAAAESGLVDVGPKSTMTAVSTPSAATNEPTTVPSMMPEAQARNAVAAQLEQVAPGLGAPFLAWLDRGQEFMRSVGDWTETRWDGMPKPMRTLLLASGAAGGFVGFVVGLAGPVWAATTVTSLFGALLVVACGLPLASRVVPPESMPRFSTMGWLATWLALAVAGWAFQWCTRAKKSKAKRIVVEEETAAA